jgi:hypothetical protein
MVKGISDMFGAINLLFDHLSKILKYNYLYK